MKQGRTGHSFSSLSVEIPVKPLPAPNVPGKTEFDRFDSAMRQVLTVSKEELLKRETREKNARERKKQPKKSS